MDQTIECKVFCDLKHKKEMRNLLVSRCNLNEKLFIHLNCVFYSKKTYSFYDEHLKKDLGSKLK